MAERWYVAGHTGLVGSALMRRWRTSPGRELLTATRAELDLTDGLAVRRWLAQQRPDVVVLAAGLVGGIAANLRAPADFIYHNVMIEANVVHGAWQAGVRRLLNFGSACMYPRVCPQPMAPAHLMSGPMEPTSEPYALAKWAGLSMCAAYNRQHGTRFITAIPATVYGPGDSFDPDSAHVISALIRKFHEATEQAAPSVTLWGSGQARREFLFVDDVAEACDVVLQACDGQEPINIGSGAAVTIAETAEAIAETVGFRGDIRWDQRRPDGAPAKVLDSSRLRALGWVPRTGLPSGLRQTYRWFLEHKSAFHNLARTAWRTPAGQLPGTPTKLYPLWYCEEA